MLKKPLLISLALGIATSVVVGIIDTYAPYSEARDLLLDVFTVAGALIAGIAYPEGAHTGLGVTLWIVWVSIANLAVYVAFWYGCIRLVLYVWRKIGPPRSSGPG